MKIILAPDKFKGTLTSSQVCLAIADGIQKEFPAASLLHYPMADGGDGFDAVLNYYLNTTTKYCNTVDPLMRPIMASYQYNSKSSTAIIALAAASGLSLLNEKERNPMYTSTYGTGILIEDAIRQGAHHIILGLGGSATNDAGIGILNAMDFGIEDACQRPVIVMGKNLIDINKISLPADLRPIQFTLAADVTQELFGDNGAAKIFAPQKGADAIEVALLDEGLKHINNILYQATGKDNARHPGIGAAGGAAAALMAFFDCTICNGAEIVIKASNLPEVVKDADLVITGEGKLDLQTLSGKVIMQVARVCRQYHVPVVAICGKNELQPAEVDQLGLSAVYEIINNEIALQQAITHAGNHVTSIAQKVAKDFFFRENNTR